MVAFASELVRLNPTCRRRDIGSHKFLARGWPFAPQPSNRYLAIELDITKRPARCPCRSLVSRELLRSARTRRRRLPSRSAVNDGDGSSPGDLYSLPPLVAVLITALLPTAAAQYTLRFGSRRL